jgi:branched-chain amino acid transport system substrate-binding protein
MRSHPHRARYLALGTAALMVSALTAACGSSPSTPTSSSPILIGASLSLTGDFSADGQAYERGYELWASDVNASGGLLGRKVKLIILNDDSMPTQVDTNYTDLITVKHVDLTFGPFSSLLTAPSAEVANRYDFAFV